MHSSVGLSFHFTLLHFTSPVPSRYQKSNAELLSSTGDYCDVYLTHDSMSVRKAHNSGRNHERNVLDYYQRIYTILRLCFSLPILQQSKDRN